MIIYVFGALFILLVLTPLLVAFAEWLEPQPPSSFAKLSLRQPVHFGLMPQQLAEKTTGPVATNTD
jgi:hypothetical protein